MYQALYRKYRPTVFEEVYGQETITRTLKNAIKNNKLTHAYLFTGPRGTGKTTIAKILAKTINCTNLTDLTPCNNCSSCIQINQKQSTDIIEIDAASNNGVDEIREIRNKVNLVPSISKYKVYIIDEVHMLTTGAFNALLKTLEEPPAHVIFVLATTEPHKIPATILSRCQRFDFKKISVKKIAERLKFIVENEKIEIEETAIFEIARLSDGGMRDAISMLDQVISYSEDKITINDVHEINGTLSQQALGEFIDNLLSNNLTESLKLVDKYNDQGKNLIKLTEEILLFLKNLLLFQTIPNYFSENNEMKEVYQNLNEKVDNLQLIQLIEELNESINKQKFSNDPKILLEILLIKQRNTLSHRKVTEKITNSEQKTEVNEQKAEKEMEIKNVDNQNEKVPEKTVETVIKTQENKGKNEVSVNSTENPILVKIRALQTLRINNTLSKFEKKSFLSIKQNLEKINDYLLQPECSRAASMILDGQLKAASETNMIFVYETSSLSDYFNENLIMIEELIEKIYDRHYCLIATDAESWEIIKKEFNTKEKEYKYEEETISLQDLFTPEEAQDEISNLNALFGDIVEYN